MNLHLVGSAVVARRGHGPRERFLAELRADEHGLTRRDVRAHAGREPGQGEQVIVHPARLSRDRVPSPIRIWAYPLVMGTSHPIPVASSAVADAAGQRRTALASIVAATLLLVLKLGTGLVTGSLGLVSAGIESCGDVVAATVTFFAVRLGARPADPEHPYGHRRAENLSALAEATILLAGGSVVVVEAIAPAHRRREFVSGPWYVFAVILVAIAVDASRVFVSLRTARRYGSAALRSNAFHFAGDMAGSIAVLAGLIAVRAGFADGDAVAALIVAVIIFAAAGRLIFENAQVLMDTDPAVRSTSAPRGDRRARTGDRAGPPATARVRRALLRRRRRVRPARPRGDRGPRSGGRSRTGRRAGPSQQRRRRPRRTPAPRS